MTMLTTFLGTCLSLKYMFQYQNSLLDHLIRNQQTMLFQFQIILAFLGVNELVLPRPNDMLVVFSWLCSPITLFLRCECRFSEGFVLIASRRICFSLLTREIFPVFIEILLIDKNLLLLGHTSKVAFGTTLLAKESFV